MKRTVPFWCLLLFAMCSTNAMAAEKEAAPRKFADGPLRIEEFKGKPDRSKFGDAYTANRVDFSYEYECQMKGGRVEARLTSFEAYSVFVSEESWWKPSAREFLLDHEQGHFDIAEATARRLQLAFEKVFAAQKTIRATGSTKDESVKKLVAKLTRVMKAANERADLDNQEYDSISSHGMRARDQAEQRRVQKATLDRLAKELKVVRKKSRKSK